MSKPDYLVDGYKCQLFTWLRRVLFAGLLVLCSHGISAEYWSFTDTAGRKTEARIIEYDAERKTVVLKRKNGRSPAAVPLEMLSAADLEYIGRWVVGQGFLDKQRLKIRIEENATRWEDAGDDDGVREKKSTSYVIHLTNNTGIKLEGIRAEYCLYRDRRKYIETNNYGVPISDLEVGGSEQAEPRNRHTSFKRTSQFLNEVVGARFRFYMALNDDSEIMREICIPKPLPLEKYPWKEGKKVEQAKLKQLPDPASYPEKEMTKRDVEAIAEAYIHSFKEKNFNAWQQLLAPMNSNSSELTESRFSYPAHNIKRMKIEEIEGLNVRISMRNENNHEFDGWLQIHQSGHIKYGSCIIQHPVKKAFQSLRYLLAKEDSWRNTGIHALKKAKVPLCGYEIDETREKQEAAVDRILDWLIENGADHDPTEPKVVMPSSQFRKCLRDARRSISNCGHNH
ncbi:MAG: hypothetical protein ABFR33_03895 [Verrucomicrobiota bacterium]